MNDSIHNPHRKLSESWYIDDVAREVLEILEAAEKVYAKSTLTSRYGAEPDSHIGHIIAIAAIISGAVNR